MLTKDKIPNMDDITQDEIDAINANLNINWDNIVDYKCLHLLPCGVCEISNKSCPLHNWQPSWTISTEPWQVNGFVTTTTPKCARIHNTNEEENKND